MTRIHTFRITTIIGASMLLAVSVGHGASSPPAAEPVVQAPAAAPAAFASCRACHSVAKGAANGVGPNLSGIVGSLAGAKPGYVYSPAMKGSKIRWAPGKLDAYLADPKAVVPGTKMTIPGVKDSTKRAEIIAYLATLK